LFICIFRLIALSGETQVLNRYGTANAKDCTIGSFNKIAESDIYDSVQAIYHLVFGAPTNITALTGNQATISFTGYYAIWDHPPATAYYPALSFGSLLEKSANGSSLY